MKSLREESVSLLWSKRHPSSRVSGERKGGGRGGSLLKLYSRPQLLKGPLNAHGCPM